MKTLPFLSLVLALPALAGCAGAPAAGAAYVGITQTQPDEPPPPDLADQMAPHENWCYETLGYAECYTRAQNVDANRLINVDPPNQYPLTPQAYKDAVPPPGGY